MSEHPIMTQASEGTVADGLVPDEDLSHFARRALERAIAVAWLAILLGITVQLLVLAARLTFGGSFAPAQFMASMAQGISWSVLVCGVVAIGTVAARARGLLTGLIGLVAGPIAWGLAKGVQKGVQALLGVQQDPITGFFYLISAIKGVEYAILGAALGYMVGRPWAGLSAHVGLGAGVGALFAATLVPLTAMHNAAAGKAMPMPALASLTMNELAFPVGCVLVIYAVQRMRAHVDAVHRLAQK